MRRFYFLAIVFFICQFATLYAEEQKNATIAVLEFRNKTEAIRKWNGWNLAKRMEEELKKKGKFGHVDQKKLQEIVKDDASFQDRLERASEAKIGELGADYLLYPVISQWRAQDTTTSAIARVVCYFTLVDLHTGKEMKTFFADGTGTGDYAQRVEDPSLVDEHRADEFSEYATKVALQKAALVITAEIQKAPAE